MQIVLLRRHIANSILHFNGNTTLFRDYMNKTMPYFSEPGSVLFMDTFLEQTSVAVVQKSCWRGSLIEGCESLLTLGVPSSNRQPHVYSELH